MRAPLRLWAAIVFALALFCTPRASTQQDQTGSILGELRMARGDLPPQRIKVTLSTRGITVDTIYTDDSGRFFFSNLPANPYILVIDEEGFRRIEERVIVNPSIRVNNSVFLTLQPLVTREKPGVAVVEGANPNVINVAEFLNRYPKDVQKEYERGVRAEQRGKTDEAIERYEKVVRMAPDFYFARNNLGSLLTGRGEFSDAEDQFEEVIRLNQTDAAGYLNLGNVFLLTGRLSEALPMVEEGLRKQPNHPLGHFLLGSVYSRMGRLLDAERELRESLRLDPLQSRPHLEMVNVYLSQKRNADAINELKVFLEVFPEDALAPQARQVLARLEGAATNAPAQ
ncbi:MAG TPA: tetratricopeptide repeat protein [Terriglobales bacterium]|nr:tetratricopeptide repeat protein [Terriglobales bacterium]